MNAGRPSRAASADYEKPEQNVADLPEPVVLSTNKARQAVLIGPTHIVLIVGTALAILFLGIAYLSFV